MHCAFYPRQQQCQHCRRRHCDSVKYPEFCRWSGNTTWQNKGISALQSISVLTTADLIKKYYAGRTWNSQILLFGKRIVVFGEIYAHTHHSNRNQFNRKPDTNDVGKEIESRQSINIIYR